MRYLFWLGLLLFLGTGGYYFYSLPQVRSLFEPVERREDPLEFLRRGPDLTTVEPLPETAPPEPPAVVEEDPTAEPSVREPQTPNPVVSRVLLQILAGRGLADGVSLIVTDETVQVMGTVPSDQARNEILQIIDQGRGARRIDAEKLVVGTGD